MTGYSLITGLYQNFRKHLWKSHESYGIHPKKTREEKNMGKLTKKKPILGNKGLSGKKIAEPQGLPSTTFSIDTCDIVNSPLFTVAIIK